jgi:hypothetical protein
VEDSVFLPLVLSLKKKKNISFEDRERTLVELESFLFFTLYI